MIASTLPHLREERLQEFEIPILNKNFIDEITKLLVKRTFELKTKRRRSYDVIRDKIDAIS